VSHPFVSHPHYRVLALRLDGLTALAGRNEATTQQVSELLALDWALRELERLETAVRHLELMLAGNPTAQESADAISLQKTI
jgi:hypothetical protein